MRCLLPLAILFIVATTLGSAESGGFDPGDSVTVVVRRIELRSEPGFLAEVVDLLEYRSSLHVRGSQGLWLHVASESPVREGWIHADAVSSTIDAGSPGVTGIATAEVGISRRVEAELHRRTALDFSIVDEVERLQVDVGQLALFLTSGGITLGEE